MKRYSFKEILNCEMCKESTRDHKILGQRLNQSQGFNPKNKVGISVGVQQCTNCGLIYSNPQPIPFDLQDHYGTPPEQYWKAEYFVWHKEYFSTVIGIAKKLLDFKHGMKALDIGAGLGKAMLSMENEGFEASGFEPSVPFYERAISKMGIKSEQLKLGAIEDVEYPESAFDFITFGAVFEHVYEPALSLEKALNWLKPNGIIHIEVPSSRWLMPKFMNLYFKLRGTNYVTNLSPMHTPFHLHEFDLKSFQKLAAIQGFVVDRYDYTVCSIYHVPSILHPILKAYMKATNTGMQLTVYLRKK